MPQEWKYNTLHLTTPISENHLKRMGRKNWELTGCTTQAHQSSDYGAHVGAKYIYYFKMPKETAFP